MRWPQLFALVITTVLVVLCVPVDDVQAQITWEEDEDGDKKKRCPDGQERSDDTDGQCCWPGQAWNGAACVGTPVSCPKDMVPDAEQQACIFPGCKVGMVQLNKQKACCWPGQAWSSEREACVGTPQCPENHEVDGEDCEYVPPDADGDGFADARDKCPMQAEDIDGFEDEDGCPEADNDKDRFADAQDQCPNEAEDYDEYQDTDGCPEADNDKDGILDLADKCPMEAEDEDGNEDADGCPDTDNDGDEIADAIDRCPGMAEDLNGFQDEDGCPDQATADATSRRNLYVVSGSVVAGVGLAGGIAALILHLDAEGLRDEVREADRDAFDAIEFPQDEAMKKQDDANTLDTVAAIMTATGGAMIVTGAVLIAIGATEEIPEVGISATSDSAALHWRVHF